MKGKFIMCLIIGAFIFEQNSTAAEKPKIEKLKDLKSNKTAESAREPSGNSEISNKKVVKETVDKRQVDHETSINSQDQIDSIFKSPNQFVIRAIDYNNRIGSRRIHTNSGFINNIQPQTQSREQQIQQANINQADSLSLEDALPQHYGFYHEVQQPTHRFQQYRPLSEQFKPLLKKAYQPRLAQYIPQAQQLIQPQQFLQGHVAQTQQEIPQYSPHPYPIVQEDQLLKFLEEELASKGITATSQSIQNAQQPILAQKRPQQLQSSEIQQQAQVHTTHQVTSQKPDVKMKSIGLGNYKQAVPTPENVQYVYIPQRQEQQLVQNHQMQTIPIPQQLIETPPPPQYFIQQQAAPISYQTKPQNAQISQQPSFTYEKEKLYTVNKHNTQTDGQMQYAILQPSPHTYKTVTKQHTKTQAGSEKEYSFLPSLAQFSGFGHQAKLPKPQAEKIQSGRQYLPKVNYNHGQYLIETQIPPKQTKGRATNHNSGLAASPSLNSGSQLLNAKPQSTNIQYFTTNPLKVKSHNQFVPVVHNPVLGSKKENVMKLIDAPALQYQKPEPQSQHKNPSREHNEEGVTPISPTSVSTIYVSQGTGIEPTTRPIKQTHLNSQKDYKLEKKTQLKLPPPDGKPITQEEFQALVDAGYPVQAVPIPVPVPYEEYIKTHPEYKYEQERKHSPDQKISQEQGHQQQTSETNIYNTQESGVTYLHQLPQPHRRHDLPSNDKE
ncbi:uncharacterized protein LOC129609070 [Condylostylus longicornis]|uniref:uncharacterized protein LOC129609070 n=1 Tax=Condylostylus longicornis TaxID=2530218 RepID=UPI00244E3E22|nr:uncharacterized protein LOC129609070 [Condylostylus longicornis]